jgi:hypothetical protein
VKATKDRTASIWNCMFAVGEVKTLNCSERKVVRRQKYTRKGMKKLRRDGNVYQMKMRWERNQNQDKMRRWGLVFVLPRRLRSRDL